VTKRQSQHDWPIVKLGSVVKTLVAGASVNGAGRNSTGQEQAVLKISAVTEGVFKPEENKVIVNADLHRATLRPKAGRVLISRANTPQLVGASAYVEQDYDYLYLPDKLWMIEHDPKQIASGKWLQELLSSQSYREKLCDVATGTSSSMKNIAQEAFLGLRIPLPPKEVQTQISQIAISWDDAIQNLQVLSNKLEKRKQGLMQQLLTGRRRLKGFKGNWKAKRIGDFAIASSVKNKSVAELPVLSCTKHAGLVDSLSYFGRQMFSESTATYKLVKRGQFAYATNHIEEGSVGYQNLYETALISPMYTVFEVNKEIVDDQFFYKVLKTEQMRREFESATSASVARRGSLRWPVFAKLKINLPPKDEQIAISRILDDQDEQLRLANDQLQMLKAQKRALMQKLLSGQWRMPAKAMKGKKS
jgi:type I restriction enzyme, S subunit